MIGQRLKYSYLSKQSQGIFKRRFRKYMVVSLRDSHAEVHLREFPQRHASSEIQHKAKDFEIPSTASSPSTPQAD